MKNQVTLMVTKPQISFFTGKFLEQVCYNKNDQLFKVSKKDTFFYKENSIYSNVRFVESKKGF